jgi:FAD/FMN-containing dehydrogenase
MPWECAVTADAGNRLADRLRTLVRGRVLADRSSLRRYSQDQSIYRIEPRAVVLPDDPEDMARLVDFASREGVAITARGGGSGTAGAALGSGIVMALPDGGPWDRIDRFSAAGSSALVRAGAGVYHNRLQDYLRQRGFFLPADVSSAEISRIGGNIATRASGPHALRYGSIDRFVERVTFITDQGETVDTGDEKTIPDRFSARLTGLQRRLLADLPARELLESRRGLKTASGYNLSAFLDNLPIGQLIAGLLAGSVGTLGLVTDATLRVEVHEPDRAAVLLHFDDLTETARAVCALLALAPAAIELISRETAAILRSRTDLPESLAVDAHLLLVELSGPAARAEAEKVVGVARAEGLRLSAPPVVALDKGRIDRLWALRKRILWLISHPRPGFQALTVVNDVGVPPERLAAFVGEAERLFARHGLTAVIYGHAGNGNLHLRPLFDLTLPGLPGRIRRLADEVYESVLRHGGTVTAEHGMGRLRAPYLEREWGPALYSYMREVKDIFDPRELFNPGVMFSDRPITDHMREELLAAGSGTGD